MSRDRVQRYRQRQEALGRRQVQFIITDDERDSLRAELARLRGDASNASPYQRREGKPKKRPKAVQIYTDAALIESEARKLYSLVGERDAMAFASAIFGHVQDMRQAEDPQPKKVVRITMAKGD